MAKANIPTAQGQRRRTRTYDSSFDGDLITYILQNISPTGSITARITDTDPGGGWLLCDGRGVSKDEWPDLYAILGSTFGETSTTFNLPDLRNRYLVGAGDIPATQIAGVKDQTLTVDQLPVHSHTVSDPGHTHTFTPTPHDHTITDPGHNHSQDGGFGTSGAIGPDQAFSHQTFAPTSVNTTGITVDEASAGGDIAAAQTGVSVSSTGSGQSFDNRPPSIGVHWFIKT